MRILRLHKGTGHVEDWQDAASALARCIGRRFHNPRRRRQSRSFLQARGATVSTSMEATSFSEQATAARRDYFAGSNSGVGDGRAKGGSLTLRAFWCARMFAMSTTWSRSSRAPPQVPHRR